MANPQHCLGLLSRENPVKKWDCAVCGYVCDPQEGDREKGMKPGTPFEKLPKDWGCPGCGAAKDQFKPVEA